MRKTADLLEYDWPYEGAPAVYAVDMSLEASADPKIGVCVQLALTSRDVKRAELNPRELRHAEKLIERIAGTDAVLAGSITALDTALGIFYVSSVSDIEPVKALCDRERVVLSSITYKENDAYATYRKLLYPDAAKLWTVENGKRIDFFEQHGDAVSPARKLTFHVYFPTEQQMLMFSEQARLSGFALGEREYQPEQELVYGVLLHKITTLNKQDMDACTTRIVRIAERLGGRLTYWESPVTRSGSPLMRK